MRKTQRWLVLAAVSAGLLMVSVDTTVLYTALPTLTGDLQAGASQKLWIINAYPLVMAGLLLGAGTLGDRIGHKRMYLTGLALFAAASLLAAFAPSPPVLIAARAFLAVGAAAMLPATAALIRITFDDEHERGIAIGIWGTMAVLGAALGPIVGGLLLQRFWWGSVFLLNIPVVLLALAATAAFVPGGSGRRDRPWDLIASGQAMIALAGLVYAIQEAAKPGPMPLAIVLALLAAAVGSVTFVRRQRRQAYPLIDFSLFGNRSLLAGVIAAALAMAATAGAELLLTQRLQLVLGLTPLHAGLIVTAFAAGSLPVGVLAGGLVHRTGARPLIGGGLLLGALGVLVTLLLTPGAVPGMGRAGPGPGRRGPGHRHGRRLGRDHQRRPAAARRHGLLHRVGLLRTRQPGRRHRLGNHPHRRLHRHHPPPRDRSRPGRRQHRPSPRRRKPPPRRPSPHPAGRRRQRLRPWLHPRPGHHRRRPGRRQRLHLPLPHPAARHPRRTGPAPRR
jgi:MFS transporter, DHA2 family, multidrug resistance protein